jgi:hypothetical protein
VSGYIVECDDCVGCVRMYYGMNFVTVVCVICVMLWAANEDVSMVKVVFYESESEQQR